uniref:receptor-like protein kinase FERONIA n=1 Tax=Erigeron canadensis TaxID=72917 RepID=UPI001CB8EFD8|nr:receptor-like protein kinase FERONIA [Erigeron canadensis]
MKNRNIYFLLEQLSCFVLLVHVVLAANYAPRDKILLNCGANGETSDIDGRKWITDIGSKYVPPGMNSIVSDATLQKPSVPITPYMTARVFSSEYTYSFPLASGRKFLRLYFYPADYPNFDVTKGVFSVNAGQYTLLKNFSAYDTATNLNYDFISKEYSINVESGTLNVTFTPSRDTPNSYAFINGIEIVSHPDIYAGTSMLVGTFGSFDIDNFTALENVYRLNVGGQAISVNGDTGMYRQWEGDTAYIFGTAIGVSVDTDQNITISYPAGMPDYVAPVDVYETARSMGPTPEINLGFNLSWYFDVDTGFSYLVRLHFCEVAPDITKINQRVFEIFINNETAQPDADVIAWTTKSKVPVYKDYVVYLPSESPRQDLWLKLHPNTYMKPNRFDAILNGLEIFKINSSDGNLAGALPNPIQKQDIIDLSRVLPHDSGNKNGIIGGAIGGGIAAIFLVGFFLCFVSRRRKEKNQNSSDVTSNWIPLSLYENTHSSISTAKTNTTGSYARSAPSNLGRHFSFAEIKAATNNFDEARLLGEGGFGKVYKGEIDDGKTEVAIKRGNPLSDQGVNEFRTEIEMLSKLRHRHLVSLIGYCEEDTEMILVYDYMAHGTLREHLYKTQNLPLTWKKRLEICIGAASGLNYLHTGAKHTIIHRDVKTTNILLDKNWVAKVSDFGLSKTGPAMDHSHVSTVVKGSFGYLDPEYYRRQKLTEKSDVYSFGVVLFEILTARPALDPALPKEQVSLAEWALHSHKVGMLDQIIDPYLRGKIAPECFKIVTETAVKCLADVGTDRPSMWDVLHNLNTAIKLQESRDDGSANMVDEVSDEMPLNAKSKNIDGNLTDSTISNGLSTTLGGQSLATVDSDGLTGSDVFSQIMNLNGR